MTALETHAGRGELYCGNCDLTIGGNEAKTPDELMRILGRGECENACRGHGFTCSICGYGERFVRNDSIELPNFCPNCGKAVKR